MSPSSERVLELLGRILPAERLRKHAPGGDLSPRPLAAPASEDEAVEVLRLARSEGWTLLPVGHASKLTWMLPPARLDFFFSSENLRGVTAYEPADGTITARAGTPWSELVTETRARHHLAPEIPASELATLGGTIAAGTSGLDRLRHGPLRHQILGLTALHADATRVKSGGRVVKNVTGYDLHRLWCGSQGSVCFLLEATLRLYPAQSSTVVLRAACRDLADALARCHALVRARVQPLAAVVTSRAERHEVAVVLAGRSEAVASESEAARAHLGATELLEGAAASAARAELRELERAGGRWVPLVVTARPSRLLDALDFLQTRTRALALENEFVLHPLLAAAWIDFPGLALSDPRLLELAKTLGEAGLHARWRGLGARTPPPRLSDTAHALMQRIKASLDPHGLFAGGPG
jgi:FAD/FMN-containing dehydrogenase